MLSFRALFLSFFFVQLSLAQEDDADFAIRVLLNKGLEADKLELHCSAPERVFLEQAVNVGADKTMRSRRERTRGRRNLLDCRWYCKNIVPGYCYLRTPLCRGYRRNLLSSFGDSFTDFSGFSVPSFPVYGDIADYFGFGTSDGDDGMAIPDWVEESDLMSTLDETDFSSLISDFGLEDSTAFPAELTTAMGSSCDTEIATTEALLFKLLEEDLSVQCLELLRREMTFECILLD